MGLSASPSPPVDEQTHRDAFGEHDKSRGARGKGTRAPLGYVGLCCYFEREYLGYQLGFQTMSDGVIGKPISVSILVLTEASGKCGYITGIKSND